MAVGGGCSRAPRPACGRRSLARLIAAAVLLLPHPQSAAATRFVLQGRGCGHTTTHSTGSVGTGMIDFTIRNQLPDVAQPQILVVLVVVSRVLSFRAF